MTTYPYTATLTAPLHHGAGSAGNTSLLRTEEVIQPDGSTASVPFVSGNSVRNRLRVALAWHLAQTLALEPGSLSKPVVDLLWSGGAITHAGAQTDLGLAREVDRVLPHLAMLGYSAGADMCAGTLHVSHLILVCTENAWRLPDTLTGTPHAAKRAGAFRSEAFGTRHDIEGTPAGRYIATLDAVAGGSTQMIYDHQTLKPGSVLSGKITLTPAATSKHALALGAALTLAAPDGTIHLGAKGGVGYGTAQVDGLPAGDVDAWTSHLHDHADEIPALLDRIVA